MDDRFGGWQACLRHIYALAVASKQAGISTYRRGRTRGWTAWQTTRRCCPSRGSSGSRRPSRSGAASSLSGWVVAVRVVNFEVGTPLARAYLSPRSWFVRPNRIGGLCVCRYIADDGHGRRGYDRRGRQHATHPPAVEGPTRGGGTAGWGILMPQGNQANFSSGPHGLSLIAARECSAAARCSRRRRSSSRRDDGSTLLQRTKKRYLQVGRRYMQRSGVGRACRNP